MTRQLLDDLRHAVHVLRDQRRTALVCVLILAVCIGANTAMFSILQRITVRPFPAVDRQDRLMAIGTWDGSRERCCALSQLDLEDLRRRMRSVDGILGAKLIGVNVGTADRPAVAGGQLVTANFFGVARVRPLLGRTFVAGEDRPGAAPVAVISERLWRERFASSRDIIGSAQLLNGRPFTIIGVVPASFRGLFVGYWIDVWVPLSSTNRFIPRGAKPDDRRDAWLSGYARLRPGASAPQADAEVRSIARQLAREYPTTNGAREGAAFPLARSPYGATPFLAPAMTVLMIVVLVVLLIACTNVAGLQLVRALERARELAIRAALGASAARLFRQLLVENLLLAFVAGIAGLAIAVPLTDVAGMFLPPRRVRVDLSGEINTSVLLVNAALSLLADVICGLLPALQARKLDLSSVLKEESTGSSAGPARARTREALVVAQVCLCVILCVTAGLFVQQSRAVGQLDPGFRTRGILLASWNFFASGYDSAQAKTLLPRIARSLDFARDDTGGARDDTGGVTFTSRVPLSLGDPEHSEIRVDGYLAAPGEKPSVAFTAVGPRYIDTMGTRVLAGRDFDARDSEEAAMVCAINDALRARYFPRVDPVGRRLFLDGKWRTIVAVVANTKIQRLTETPHAHAYVPMMQSWRGDGMFVVRGEGSSAALSPHVRAAMRDVAPRLTPFLTTIEDHMRTAAFGERMAATLIGILGALALLLAMIGVYAVISYGVTRRARELAILIVLGAAARDIRRLVMNRGARIAALGLALGIAGAFAASTMMRDQLAAIRAFDLAAYGIAIVVIASAALLAS